MKKLQKLLFLSICITSIFSKENSDSAKSSPSIVLCFNEFPREFNADQLEAEHDPVAIVDASAENIFINHRSPVSHLNIRQFDSTRLSGIPILYYGFLTYSRHTGIVFLPQMHAGNEFTLIITPMIHPIFMFESTVHHFELVKNNKTLVYQITKKHDTATDSYLWIVKKVDLPENNLIPLEAIVLLVHPDEVYIPEGASLTQNTHQSVFPTIYVKHNNKRNLDALSALEVNFLFRTIDSQTKT